VCHGTPYNCPYYDNSKGIRKKYHQYSEKQSKCTSKPGGMLIAMIRMHLGFARDVLNNWSGRRPSNSYGGNA
jgi:hypothetical protein